MGIELVKLLLLQHAAALSGRAFKVLAFMASTALDKPNTKGQPARLYFAGEAPLVTVLYGLGAEPNPTRLREVRRVLKELRDAGLIEPQVDKAGWDRRQSFALRIGGALGGETAPGLGGENAHPMGGESAPSWVGNLPTPRKDSGASEDLSQDSTPIPSALTPDRARDAEIRIDPVAPHIYAPDAYGASCDVCNLPETHQRHRRIA